MLRKILLAAVLTLPLFPASADEQAAANEQCVTVANAAAPMPPDTPDAQKKQVADLIGGLCGCITERIAALGDDGQKVLHVIAKTTLEQSQAAAADPTADRKLAIGILMADFSMSEADANALYDRVDPQVKQINQECTAKALEAAQAPKTP